MLDRLQILHAPSSDPSLGIIFFVFLNFEKMTDFWHFESSQDLENFSAFSSAVFGYFLMLDRLQILHALSLDPSLGTFFSIFEFRKNYRFLAFLKLPKV